MSFRKALFWMHLIAGCTGGLIILIMSLTGVILTYERQILARMERGAFRTTPPPSGAARLTVEELLTAVNARQGRLPGGETLTLRSDPLEPAELTTGRDGAFYVSPYTGEELGKSSTGWRTFFREVTAWHRWLGAKGEGRTIAKAITGACNLAFLLLVLSGPILWLPKQWSRRRLSGIVWFRGGLSGKARDFNWHNVFGIWLAVPLAFVVVTALPMSYAWANRLLYQMTNSELPAAGRPGGGVGAPGGPGATVPVADLAGLSTLWMEAERRMPDWRSITMRLPESSRRPVSFTIDSGDGGQPQKRATLTLDRAGSVVRWETFAGNSAGRRLRSWTRFIHTGEAFGLAGQTLAGLASLAGVLLVWTGLALSLRRFQAWRRRQVRERELAGAGRESRDTSQV